MLRGPEETGAGARLVVAITRAASRPATGTLTLSVASGWPDFGPGETIACLARLRELTLAAMDREAVRARTTEVGMTVHARPAEAMASFLREDIARWAEVIRTANVKPE